MKVIIALVFVVGITQARPQFFQGLANAARNTATNAANAVITKFDNFVNELGEYSYTVETSDGQLRYESRKVINPGTDQESSYVEGYYSYIDPNGERKSVGYTSGENGFYAEGEHLPGSANTRRKPPEVGIPPNCVQSLCAGNSIG